jgi:hypothetical protein
MTAHPADPHDFCWPCAAAPAAPARRVLLLAYYTPPHPSVASHRPEALYHWLRHYGWEPTLLAPEREGIPEDVIQTPDASWLRQVESSASVARALTRNRPGPLGVLLRAAKRFLRRFPRWHDEFSTWSYSIVPRAIEEGRRRGVDLVWATCSPFSLAPAAVTIARALNVPCVLDLRDPLPENLLYTRGAGHWFYRNLAEMQALTLATTSCATPLLRQMWGERPMAPILSGMWQGDPVPAQSSDQFTILHAGMLYGGQRDPGPLFQAVAMLAAELPDFRRHARIRLVGGDSAAVRANPHFPPVADLCELLGQTPYREVRTMMAAASTLLILMGDEWYLRDAVPAKLYDYLPFEAPVLAIGGQRGILAELLEWSRAGAWATTPEVIAAFLRAHYQAWQADGITRAPRNSEALAYLTQQRMAAECAEVFNATVEHRPIACREQTPWQQPTL